MSTAEQEAAARKRLQDIARRIRVDRTQRAWECAVWRRKYIADAVAAAMR